jgi:hypothetical protein
MYIICVSLYIIFNSNQFNIKTKLIIDSYSNTHYIINNLLNNNEYSKIISYGLDNLNNIIDYLVIINYLINMDYIYYSYQLYNILYIVNINKYYNIVSICQDLIILNIK